jgi:hypothetical protein
MVGYAFFRCAMELTLIPNQLFGRQSTTNRHPGLVVSPSPQLRGMQEIEILVVAFVAQAPTMAPSPCLSSKGELLLDRCFERGQDMNRN